MDTATHRKDQPRQGDWAQTYTGGVFWPLDPRPEDVSILDIAHALSNTCRYGGHTLRFYSVAEHSVLLANVALSGLGSFPVKAELARLALMHDAAEAYVGDIPRPLKPYLTGYAEIEARVHAAICDRFGLPHEIPEAVKRLDNAILHNEKRWLMAPCAKPWELTGEELRLPLIKGLLPAEARDLFLAKFYALFPEHRPA